MSDAIELSIGGSNKGFVAVLNDTEQKAKETAGKVSKEFDKVGSDGIKGKAKIKADLGGIASEFSRCTSLSDAFRSGLGEIGKVAGIGTLAVAFGTVADRIYDAMQEVKAFDLELEKLRNKNRGGVGGYSLSELQSNFAEIKARREQEANVTRGADGSQSFLKTYGKIASAYAANLGEFITTGKSKTAGELNSSQVMRDENLKKEGISALDRVAEKEREIWKIQTERIKGGKEMAALMEIEAVYAEKIQAAIKAQFESGGSSVDLQRQLKSEREALIQAEKLQQGVALSRRVSSSAASAMLAGDSQRALKMSSEAEQRQSWGTRIAIAGFAESDAKKAFDAQPHDPELENRYRIAANNTKQIIAESAKWERDIVRSKSDALRLADAEIQSMNLRMNLRSGEADIAERSARAEVAAEQAMRAGNTALAQRIRETDQLVTKQRMLAAATDPETGQFRSDSSQMHDISSMRRAREKFDRHNRRFEERKGLVNVSRDMEGNVIGGWNPVTGKFEGNRGGADALVRSDKSNMLEPRMGTVPHAFGENALTKGDLAARLQPMGIGEMFSRSGQASTTTNAQKEMIAKRSRIGFDAKREMDFASNKSQAEAGMTKSNQEPKTDQSADMITKMSTILQKWDAE